MDNFQAAKDQMQKAGQVAAQVGMDTVQSLQETATRLLLKVNMKAPVIVVPQNSTSSNTLMLDFGQLSITNSFKLAGKLSPNNVPAILEEMNIVLTSLKLSRYFQSYHISSCIIRHINISVEIDIPNYV